MALAIYIAPFLEELVKFIAYRGMHGKYTVAIPIACVAYETIAALVRSQMLSLELVIIASLMNLAMLKHLVFWAPAKFFNFGLLALPMMVLLHMLWNLQVGLDGAGGVLAGGGLAIGSVFLALALYKD